MMRGANTFGQHCMSLPPTLPRTHNPGPYLLPLGILGVGEIHMYTCIEDNTQKYIHPYVYKKL